MVADMKATLILTVLFVLAGCATAPTGSPSASTPTPALGAASSRVTTLLSRAGAVDAPTRTEIERALGAPDVARNDGAGALLTYRGQSCALVLIFTSDQRNAMRLRETHAEARRAGETAPSLEQCASEASAR
jgi:hypothetical protein